MIDQDKNKRKWNNLHFDNLLFSFPKISRKTNFMGKEFFYANFNLNLESEFKKEKILNSKIIIPIQNESITRNKKDSYVTSEFLREKHHNTRRYQSKFIKNLVYPSSFLLIPPLQSILNHLTTISYNKSMVNKIETDPNDSGRDNGSTAGLTTISDGLVKPIE